MTPCQAISGLLFMIGCLYAAKGRTTGLTESEQRSGAWVVYLAIAIMLFGAATGN